MNGDLKSEIKKSIKYLPSYDYMLGRTLMQPFRPANSGSRALMTSVHTEHLLIPTKGEIPIVNTGYENQFGKYSTSLVESSANYTIIAKVNKFELSNSNYYLIIRDNETGEYDYILRTPCHHNTESYGYLWNNTNIDAMRVGDIIAKGEIIKSSNGFDDCQNKINGVNFITLYLSSAQNLEDSVIISESAAAKFETSLIKESSITINDNDILLNLYGDNNVYKTFPDIGESIKGGVFCGIRRLENDNILYSLSQSRLKEVMLSDRTILLDGIVADINIYCNNPEVLANSMYNQQLYYYYLQSKRFNEEIVNIVAPLAINGKLSYNLQKLYAIARDTLAGKQFFKDKQFSNTIMDITIIEPLEMNNGDKMADRYGGKGVVSKIIPDEYMPLLDNGKRVEVIKNQSTCINRENIGQLHELSLNYIGMRVIDYLHENVNKMKPSELCKVVFDFVRLVDYHQALCFESYIDLYDEEACAKFINSIFEDDAILLSVPPFTSDIDIFQIKQIEHHFDFVKPYRMYVYMEDSNGNPRQVLARRPVFVGKIYNYRLKQYAKEKFSVTSTSATNIKGLNTRSRASKIHEAKYTKTPIQMGNMETCNMMHIGVELTIIFLLLYSNSPQARRMFINLLVGDPMDINITIDENCVNRVAEIIAALLKTANLALVFEKRLKQMQTLCNYILCRELSDKELEDLDPEFDKMLRIVREKRSVEERYKAAINEPSINKKPLCKTILCKEIEHHDEE